MSLEPAWLQSVLDARLPRSSERALLELVPWSGSAGYGATKTGASALGLWACLTLRRGGSPNGSTAVCVLIDADQLETPEARALAYLEGWLSALDEVMARAAPPVLEFVMPANLTAPRVLRLARPQTADAFRAAILAPSRLGKLLGDPVAAMRSLDAGRA